MKIGLTGRTESPATVDSTTLDFLRRTGGWAHDAQSIDGYVIERELIRRLTYVRRERARRS